MTQTGIDGIAPGGGASPGEPLVRTARPDDVAALADVLMEALGVKYRPALGPRARPALVRLIRDEIISGGTGYLVAVRDGEVIGAAHLSVAEEPGLAGIGSRLAACVGRVRATWALAVLSLLAHGPLDHDEAYIGELGVAPSARRSGVATRMLDEIERRAAQRGKRRMTLWVTTENAGARALYARLGFREVRHRRWLLGGPLFGSRGALLMEKEVAGDATG